MKKIVVIIGAFIILGFILFPKEYDQSGGFAGFPPSDENRCIGYTYTTYPEGCSDCFTTHWCAGIVISNSNE